MSSIPPDIGAALLEESLLFKPRAEGLEGVGEGEGEGEDAEGRWAAQKVVWEEIDAIDVPLLVLEPAVDAGPLEDNIGDGEGRGEGEGDAVEDPPPPGLDVGAGRLGNPLLLQVTYAAPSVVRKSLVIDSWGKASLTALVGSPVHPKRHYPSVHFSAYSSWPAAPRRDADSPPTWSPHSYR